MDDLFSFRGVGQEHASSTAGKVAAGLGILVPALPPTIMLSLLTSLGFSFLICETGVRRVKFVISGIHPPKDLAGYLGPGTYLLAIVLVPLLTQMGSEGSVGHPHNTASPCHLAVSTSSAPAVAGRSPAKAGGDADAAIRCHRMPPSSHPA